MKKLLSTTALVVALGFPAVTLAQSNNAAANSGMQQHNGEMSGFLSARGQSDMMVSDLMGLEVYARRTGQGNAGQGNMGQRDNAAAGAQGQGNANRQGEMNADRPAETHADAQNNANAQGQGMDRNQSQNRGTMTRADIDNMENIGQINEIVLSHDGEVRALIIGVGGFLGLGEQEVAVTMDQVTFATDGDDASQVYVMLNTGADMLMEAPAYDRTASMDNNAQGNAQNRDAQNRNTQDRNAQAGAERSGFAAPQMQREGYAEVKATEVSSETLMGKSVYDANDNDVGSVTDLIIGEDGSITNVIIDFGGFLGIGSSQAALDYSELTILSTEGYADVRLYVDASKEQIQNLPQYR